MEISQAIIAKADADTKLTLTDDIMRLLQVRQKNEQMSKDWILFVTTSNFKITAGEIYLAFTMAMSRELLDSKGNEFDLLPELSNNTTGKVIAAYLRYKAEDYHYNNEKTKLVASRTPIPEVTEEQKAENTKKLRKMTFDTLQTEDFCDWAWLHYEDLIFVGSIAPTNEQKNTLYQEQLKLYQKTEKQEIQQRGGLAVRHTLKDFSQQVQSKTPLAVVVNTCKSITVCQYLKQYANNFETFINQFNPKQDE